MQNLNLPNYKFKLKSNENKTLIFDNIRKKYYPHSLTEIRISGIDNEKNLDRKKFKNFNQ